MYLMQMIGNFPGRPWIKAWLESGVMEGMQLKKTTAGTPQGGVISPLLANIALHGMEECLDIQYSNLGWIQVKSAYALVRYADDFVVFAKSRSSCEIAKSKIQAWLSVRGLQLSEEKTMIRHIDQGFDFLGFNIRHYRTRAKKKGKVFLNKPSKDSIRSFRQQMTIEWKKGLTWNTEELIGNLNPKIKGWCQYFRIGVSKETYSTLDHWMFIRQKRFVERRHPNKYWWWRKKQYWGKIQGRNDFWVFMAKNRGKTCYLWKLSWTPIKRHIMVKGNASPDNPEEREYWQKRQARNSKYLFKRRSILWRKQAGKCPVCNDNIDNGEAIHIHHIRPKKKGGDDSIDNLAMLHANCHRQLHSKQGRQLADVSKLLEPYAG